MLVRAVLSRPIDVFLFCGFGLVNKFTYSSVASNMLCLYKRA